MAWYADLSVVDYFGPASEILRAVGWLERGHSFATGKVEPQLFSRLEELLRDPFQPIVSLGFHECSLCVFRAEATGTANLFVPHAELVYVCPELILHYINAHGYQPPDEFAVAVLKCPSTRSIEYKKLLVSTGLTRLIGSQIEMVGDGRPA